MYDQLMALNAQAFTAKQIEVAYHILMAAMHGAEDLADEKRLAETVQRAREQRDWIDTRMPDHHLSAQSASTRGTQAVFHAAVRQGEVMLSRMKMQARIEELHQSARQP